MQVSAETFAGKRVWSGDAESFLHVRDQIAETLRVAPTRVLLILPGEPPTNIWTEADFKSACRSNAGKENKLKLLFGLQPVYDESNHEIAIKTSKEIGVQDVVGADGFIESWRGAGVLMTYTREITSKEYYVPRINTALHRIEATVQFVLTIQESSWTSRRQGDKWVLDPGDHGILPATILHTWGLIHVKTPTCVTFLYRRMKNAKVLYENDWLAKYKKLAICHMNGFIEVFPSDSNVIRRMATKIQQKWTTRVESELRTSTSATTTRTMCN